MNLYLVLATRIDKDGPWYTYVALPTFWVQSGCDEDAEKRAKMIHLKTIALMSVNEVIFIGARYTQFFAFSLIRLDGPVH